MITAALLSSLTYIYFIFILHRSIFRVSFFRVPHFTCCKGDTPQFPTVGELVAQLGREVKSSVHQMGLWFPLANEMGTEWIMSIQAEIVKDIAIIQHCFPLSFHVTSEMLSNPFHSLIVDAPGGCCSISLNPDTLGGR